MTSLWKTKFSPKIGPALESSFSGTDPILWMAHTEAFYDQHPLRSVLCDTDQMLLYRHHSSKSTTIGYLLPEVIAESITLLGEKTQLAPKPTQCQCVLCSYCQWSVHLHSWYIPILSYGTPNIRQCFDTIELINKVNCILKYFGVWEGGGGWKNKVYPIATRIDMFTHIMIHYEGSRFLVTVYNDINVKTPWHHRMRMLIYWVVSCLFDGVFQLQGYSRQRWFIVWTLRFTC